VNSRAIGLCCGFFAAETVARYQLLDELLPGFKPHVAHER
jgi:hypothetical protein